MRTDHPRDCALCWSSEEHALFDYEPMTDQDLYQAITGAAYLLGNRRNANVSTSAYQTLAAQLNRLALIADDRYQAARKAGR